MKSKLSITLGIIVCQLLLFSYRVAACPMCQAGATKRTQSAYLNTTVLLMSIPIVSAALLVVWLKNKYKGE